MNLSPILTVKADGNVNLDQIGGKLPLRND